MKAQSRRMSLTEAITSTAVGYVIAVLTQLAVFPIFGLATTLGQNLAMGGIFTVVSIVRGYAVRRACERCRRGAQN